MWFNNAYVYDVENIRTKKCVGETITEYTHNANSKLSQLLMKTEGNVTTYYVYGRGLIGEEVDGAFKTYHYDYRGSTVALTNLQGSVTDTFAYDTYGKLISHNGNTSTPFLYNGRDGVMSDENGLVYMRARYYSPELKRFINADVVAGSITNAITLNRYAYANGNPVSNIDPFGLCSRDITVQDRYTDLDAYYESYSNANTDSLREFFGNFGLDFDKLWGREVGLFDAATGLMLNDNALDGIYKEFKNIINSSSRPSGMGKREWKRLVNEANEQLDVLYGKNSVLSKCLKGLPFVGTAIGAGITGIVDVLNGVSGTEVLTNFFTDLTFGLGGAAVGAAVGSLFPGLGTVAGIAVGIAVDGIFYFVTEVVEYKETSLVELVENGFNQLFSGIFD